LLAFRGAQRRAGLVKLRMSPGATLGLATDASSEPSFLATVAINILIKLITVYPENFNASIRRRKLDESRFMDRVVKSGTNLLSELGLT
jgi:hypothetical protein